MLSATLENFRSAEAVLKANIDALQAKEMYSSCEVMISLFLSSLAVSNVLSDIENITLKSSYTEKLADICYTQENYKRAIELYRQVWTLLKRLSNLKTPSRNLKISSLAMTSDESQVKYKEVKCLVALKDNAAALQEFESIPFKFRDSGMHMLLGKLYKISSMKRQAISSYKEALKQSPLCIEAMNELCSLGETYENIISVINDSGNAQSILSLFPDDWLNRYIHSLITKRDCNYELHCQTIDRLNNVFPQNYHLLAIRGTCAVDCERANDALAIYKQIRSIDVYIYDQMDRFAWILHHLGEINELNKLANDILAASVNSPTGWIVVALFCDLKGHTEKCMNFIDRAIALDYRYPFSYVVKGKFLMMQGNHKQAAVSYFQASILQKDLSTLSGLIQTNITLERYKDALTNAKEALDMMPNSSFAFYLMGKVLYQNPKLRNDCVKACAKAIRINPSNGEASMLLAEALEKLNKGNVAIDCLKNVINQGISSPKIRIQLAKLYVSQNRLNEAIAELHSAAVLYPNQSDGITQELEIIESKLRGERSMIEGHSDVSGDQKPNVSRSYRNDRQRDDYQSRDRSYLMSSSVLEANDASFNHSRIYDGIDVDEDEMDESHFSYEGNLQVDRELFADLDSTTNN